MEDISPPRFPLAILPEFHGDQGQSKTQVPQFHGQIDQTKVARSRTYVYRLSSSSSSCPRTLEI